jgi:hypothetical protein
MYSVNLKKTEQHAALALRERLRLRPGSLHGLEALRERSYPSKFDSTAFDRLRPRARRRLRFACFKIDKA